jgi:hypothetical protein
MNVLPGEHTLTVYAPICHYFQSSKLSETSAKYWAERNRSQLLGALQCGSLTLRALVDEWNDKEHGTPKPALDCSEANIHLDSCTSQRVFLRPTFSLPTIGFFADPIPSTIASTNSKGCIEIPVSEVAKNKMADFLSFNAYSYFFPRARACEWQRNSKVFGNRGSVTVTVSETMTLRAFVKEYVCASGLWKGGELWASDIVVGENAVEWQMGKYIPAQSKFKVVPPRGQSAENPELEGCNTVGSGGWPSMHPHMT